MCRCYPIFNDFSLFHSNNIPIDSLEDEERCLYSGESFCSTVTSYPENEIFFSSILNISDEKTDTTYSWFIVEFTTKIVKYTVSPKTRGSVSDALALLWPHTPFSGIGPQGERLILPQVSKLDFVPEAVAWLGPSTPSV